MKKLILIILFIYVKQVNAQIITTVAGTGVSGFTADGGQATASQLGSPFTGKFDAIGNMYIVDAGYYVIHKVNTMGIITTIAGNYNSGYTGDGGQATAAAFHEPIDIALWSQNIYVSDDGNNVIRMINTAGIISTIAGTGVAGFSGDGGPATAAQLNSQNSIAFDAFGNLFIADGSNNRIRMVNTAGIISTVVGNGTAGYNGDGGQATTASIQNPTGIALDVTGNLYMVDATNYIRKINAAGIITTIAGTGVQGFSGDGGQATAAQINFANGITLDYAGNLYIADWQNNRVRKINTAGIIITIAGNGIGAYSGDGGQANAAEIHMPGGVFFDAQGSLFIADDYNSCIRKVTNVIPDTNEAGIVSISSPIFGCNDTIINPIVKLENYGTNALTSCVINYQLNNFVAQTYTWTGSLTSGQTINVNLPTFTLTTAGSHTLLCYCSNPNNVNSNFTSIRSSVNFYIAFPASLPVIEGFETTTSLPNSMWNAFHTSPSGGSDFTFTALAAATGSKSCILYNMNNVAGNNSKLQTTSSYDMTTFTTPLLTFKAAYQQKATTNADKLQIFTSTDCGASWSARKTITSTVLASLAGGTGTSSYVPTPSQFTTYTVPIVAVANSHNVMFRWEFLADPNGVGNNLYIDDINIIDNVTGIQSIEKPMDINIYPNPNKGVFVIETNNELDKMRCNLYDVNGKIILTQTIKGTAPIDGSSLPEGIYNLSITSDNGLINKRIVILH